MKNLFIFIAMLLSVISLIGLASAKVSPGVQYHEPGAPYVSCGEGDAVNMPPGFLTEGFAHAGTVYAGSPGTPSLENGNPRAISQYDVACFQYTQNVEL